MAGGCRDDIYVQGMKVWVNWTYSAACNIACISSSNDQQEQDGCVDHHDDDAKPDSCSPSRHRVADRGPLAAREYGALAVVMGRACIFHRRSLFRPTRPGIGPAVRRRPASNRGTAIIDLHVSCHAQDGRCPGLGLGSGTHGAGHELPRSCSRPALLTSCLPRD